MSPPVLDFSSSCYEYNSDKVLLVQIERRDNQYQKTFSLPLNQVRSNNLTSRSDQQGLRPAADVRVCDLDGCCPTGGRPHEEGNHEWTYHPIELDVLLRIA